MSEPQCGVELKQSQVNDSINQLSITLNNIDDVVRDLRDRLNGVLRLESPEVAGGDMAKPPEVPIVQLALEIKDIKNRAMSTKDMLNDMIDRLEL